MYEKVLYDLQGHLAETHPILETSRLPTILFNLFLSLSCGLFMIELLNSQDKDKLLQEPPRDISHQEDVVVMEIVAMEPNVPEAWSVDLLLVVCLHRALANSSCDGDHDCLLKRHKASNSVFLQPSLPNTMFLSGIVQGKHVLRIFVSLQTWSALTSC